MLAAQSSTCSNRRSDFPIIMLRQLDQRARRVVNVPASLWMWVAAVICFFGEALSADSQPLEEDPYEQEAVYSEAIRLLYQEGDGSQKQAQRLLKKLAVAGHAQSQYALGIVYQQGIGVIESARQANRWFKESAAQSYPPAMLQLAESYLEGDGIRKDETEALSLLQNIVDPNTKYEMRVEEFALLRRIKARAHYLLGEILADGSVIDPDIDRAIASFEEAARMGEQDATMYLAIAYAEGTVVEQSVEKAKAYFELLDLQSSDALRRSLDLARQPGIDQVELNNLKEYGEEMRAAVSQSILEMQTNFAKKVLYADGDDFDAAFAAELLDVAADGGHAEAQSELGILFWRGEGVPADAEKAYALFALAAEQDWVLAKYNLSIAIEELGQIGERSWDSEALLESAAESGLLAAQVRLEGTEELGVLDPEEARDYCLEMAEKKDPRALYSLAMRRMNGWMIERETDNQALISLVMESARFEYSRAQYLLGMLYMSGKSVGQNAEIGFWWLERAARQEHPKALYRLGSCYARGIAVEVDLEKAFYNYHRSAELGLDVAKNSLAAFYNKGIYVEKDEWRASELYLQAADEGDATAAYNIGNCYLEGRGVKRDVQAGLSWISKSAEQGNLSACQSLSRIYLEGLLVDGDVVEAAYWLEKSAELGHRPAMKRTALNYFNGSGIPVNRGKAAYWITEYINRSGPLDVESLMLQNEFEDSRKVQEFIPNDYAAMIVYADLMADSTWSGYDPKEASRVLSLLAKQGFNGARFRLASLHIKGGFPGANMKKAYRIYRDIYSDNQDSDLGVVVKLAGKAALELSRCYEQGSGTRLNAKKAIEWLKIAATKGYPEAQYEWGKWLLSSGSNATDGESGVSWLLDAARMGNIKAHVMLAEMNLQRRIPDLDPNTIIAWLKDLVDSGSGEARILLRRYGVDIDSQAPRKRSPNNEKEPEINPYAPIEAA